MIFRILGASVGPRGRFLALLAVTTMAVPFAMEAQAQTAPAPKAPAPKAAAPRPAAPRGPAAPAPSAQAPAGGEQGQAPAQGQQPQQDQVQLIYAPWTKFCLKGQDANAKQ